MTKFKLRVINFEGDAMIANGRLEVTASRGYAIRTERGETSITCLACGFTSRHPNDVEQRYCGHCHTFHEEQ
jgi:hypothetical protein